MVKALVLHVGDPKTGTSSIQKVLFERRCHCETVKLDYPEVVTSFALANALRKGAEPGEADEVFPPYAFWLQQSRADVAVISAEQFSSVDPARVDKAFRKYFPDLAPEMRVVAYARPHAGRFLSAYAQRVKTGQLGKGLDKFLAEMAQSRILAMTQRFEAFRHQFGDRFVLRPMVRDELFQGDVVADFANVALSGAPFSIEGSTQANISLPVEALSGLRQVQGILRRAGVAGGTLHAVGDKLSTLVTSRPDLSGTKLGLNRALYEHLAAVTMEDAEKMDRQFFDHPVMVPALVAAGNNLSDKAASIEITDHFAPRLILRLKRAARELATALTAHKGLWVKAYKRDKGLKTFFADNAALAEEAPEAIATVDRLLGEVADLLYKACKA